MKLFAALAAALSLFIAAPAAAHSVEIQPTNPCHAGVAPWLCTKRLERSWYGWGRAEWLATSALVNNESGWNYCAHYPSTTDCGYTGSNACGIPQADPCPYAWRGHLQLWHRQVFWMLKYIRERYGDPINAYYHETHGGY